MKKKSPPVAIQLSHVTKTYVLHHEKPTFAENVMRRRKQETFTALNEINLTIYKGEKVGIIGPNGSGKTTLLKIIAGITTPNAGEVITHGKIVSLIDLEAGFHPDLTGEENIFLNGLLIGMTKDEIKKQYKKIVKFADIGRFIDAPMYTYSAGMKLRLGFSVAVHSNPDILILDEGMAVGDEDFKKKIQHVIKEFFLKKKTILFVSHWMEFIQKNCQKVYWFNEGSIINQGAGKLTKDYEKYYFR